MKSTVESKVTKTIGDSGEVLISYKPERLTSSYTAQWVVSLVGGLLLMLGTDVLERGWITYLIFVALVWGAMTLFANGVAKFFEVVGRVPSNHMTLNNEGLITGNNRLPYSEIDEVGVHTYSDARTSFAYVTSKGVQVPITKNTSKAQADKVCSLVFETVKNKKYG